MEPDCEGIHTDQFLDLQGGAAGIVRWDCVNGPPITYRFPVDQFEFFNIVKITEALEFPF